MKMNELDSLQKVPLREIWKHEAQDFTPWLAKNLELLGEELGITIDLVEEESSVGNFSVDILAKDENDQNIVIENQIEETNHDHLGKILTYTSGKDAKIMIWISKNFREEHRQAIDWFNENTDEKIQFFGIQIEAWKIGNSKPAPKFNIIAKPNDWAKIAKKNNTSVSKFANKQINFTEKFFKFYNEQNSNILKLPSSISYVTPPYQRISMQQKNWFLIILKPNSKKLSVSARFPVFRDFLAKKVLKKLKEKYKIEIEKRFKEIVEWKIHQKGADFEITFSGNFNIDNEKQYENYFIWIKDIAEKMTITLKKYSDEWTIKDVANWEE